MHPSTTANAIASGKLTRALIYAALLFYGQVMLQAVVEEKTTRIAEVLFSSVNAFQLMLGKP